MILRLLRRILPLFAWIVLLGLTSACKDSRPNQAAENIITEGPLAELNARIAADSTDHEAYAERAMLQLEDAAINKALGDINKALQLKPDYGPYLLILSDLYFAMGEAQRCRETILKALDVNEYDTDAMIKMAEFGLYHKDYAAVKRYAERALSVEDGHPRAHFVLGFSAKEQGDTALAIRHFRFATESDRDFYDAYIQLGILYAAQKDTLAGAYYHTALKLRPESIEALYNLGLHYQETERFNEAFETYNRIIRLEPGFKQAYYNIGFIHLVYLGVYDEAARYFNQAIQVDPNYVEAYYNRGYSLEKAGDVMGARRDYNKALELRPNYPLAVEGLNRLDKGDKALQQVR
ncbi:MAG TPA: tetratricopeptide repeat protein [Bacteroidales bacterium]|nr:tetratricopeptide repeat protein [Bacteroidales bacterium]